MHVGATSLLSYPRILGTSASGKPERATSSQLLPPEESRQTLPSQQREGIADLPALLSYQTVEELAQAANEAMGRAKETLDNLCAHLGVMVPPPVNLSFDSGGKLIVGEHPQQEALQRAFEQNPEQATQIKEALGLKSLAMVFQAGEVFDAAYQKSYATQGEHAAGALWSRFMGMQINQQSLHYDDKGLQACFNGKSEEDYFASVVANLGVDTGLLLNNLA